MRGVLSAFFVANSIGSPCARYWKYFLRFGWSGGSCPGWISVWMWFSLASLIVSWCIVLHLFMILRYWVKYLAFR